MKKNLREGRKIVYKATVQRELIIPFIFLTLLLLIQGWDNIWNRIVCLFVLVFNLTVLCIKYSFTIEENKVIYTTFFARFPIYQKKASPSQIKKVVFKRFNWKTKLAVIKLHKGISIRVTLFKPDSVFNELITFCEEHAIQYEKTRDYKILERLKWSFYLFVFAYYTW